MRYARGVLVILLAATLGALLAGTPRAEELEGLPLAYSGGCFLDLDGDGTRDLAMLLETNRGRDLLVLMARGDGYEAYVVRSDVGNLLLTCHWGESVTESPVVAEEGREPQTYEINGTYLRLTLPESSSAVYFWRDGGFIEAVTSD